VCINQANDEEKGSQVRMMDQIYRNASKVLVWLGEGDSSSDEAMELINRIPPKDKKVDHAINVLRTFPNITDPGWDHILRLFQRDYFTRLWVSFHTVIHYIHKT
jgi:hypothetical protein